MRTSEPKSEVREVARAYTVAVVRRLDGQRKGEVLQFLHSANLITNATNTDPIIKLVGADFSDVVHRYGSSEIWGITEVDLSNADLSGVTLRKASLCGSNLSNAWLVGADLRGADFFDCPCMNADFSGAIVDGTTSFGGAADLRGVKADFDIWRQVGVRVDWEALGVASTDAPGQDRNRRGRPGGPAAEMLPKE